MAEHADSPKAQSFLMIMAAAWHHLAQNLEKNIERPAEGVEAAHGLQERQADV
jgi:hypothetical protein